MEENVAVVLGGTAPHAELILRLKKRGYFTVLVDYLDNPPAKAVCDLHIQESTMDKEVVLHIAKEHHASIVISACVDQANITACYANEKLGLHTPYSYEIAEKITNKAYMKKVMFENDIPTSEYVYIDGSYNLEDIQVKYPAMVKPADSNTSNGVKKAENSKQLKQYLDEAISISRNNRAIVEGFMEGREISAYFYVSDAKAHLLLTNERISVTEGVNKVIRCYAIVYPARLSEHEEKQLEDIATSIAKAIGLNNSPLFFQGIYDEQGIRVIEFAPRIGGGLSYKTIEENTEFDILSAAIDSYLDNKVQVVCREPEYIAVTNVVYGRTGILGKVIGIESLIEEGIIESYVPYKSVGTEIDDNFNGASRIGAFRTRAKTKEETLAKIKEAVERLDVLDSFGNSIMRKDLYLKDID